jgi:hypothetical protein
LFVDSYGVQSGIESRFQLLLPDGLPAVCTAEDQVFCFPVWELRKRSMNRNFRQGR